MTKAERKEAAKKGYVEMGVINLSISQEFEVVELSEYIVREGDLNNE